ncbi:MAG: hypothetical protein CSA84_05360 [Actinomycetales bacterium]|nr:MAG: hypothetical protein CSA84_05360 [Actinomycetales bacterium]
MVWSTLVGGAVSHVVPRVSGMPPPPPAPPPPLSRWGRTWRYLVVVLVGLGASGAAAYETSRGWAIADGVVGLTSLLVLPWRRRRPVAVASFVALGSAVSSFAAGPLLLAVASLATRRRWREVVPVGFLVLLAYVLLQWRVGAPGQVVVTHDGQVQAAPSAFWIGVGWTAVFMVTINAVGFAVGAQRELVATLQQRVETAERQQAMRMAQARLTERSRIAREMHDVIAHRMSLVAMHAGALSFREDLSVEQTRETAELIRSNAHEALGELRSVLGVLRDLDGTGDSAVLPGPGSQHAQDVEIVPEPPQPTFADLPALLEQARAGGMDVRLEGDRPDPASVPPRLGRTIYRMVQESLTNARKHAPGAPVRVRVEARSAGLRLVVENPLLAGSGVPDVPGAGLGLTGLAERAVLAGGTFEHAALDGRFVVRAELPWGKEEP